MRIGIIGDIHAPFTHKGYRRFVDKAFTSWKVSHVHFIGDVVDAHALSKHEHDPNGESAEAEARQAARAVAAWYRDYPEATVSIGNHDERHYRAARRAGIPDRYIRSYAEVWDTPRWDWQPSHTFDGVLYEHGTGTTGKDAALNRAVQKRQSLVMGHVHTYPGSKYHASDNGTIFGLNVGCGIDASAYAFAYARPFPTVPVLGCGVVVDGVDAFFLPMPC